MERNNSIFEENAINCSTRRRGIKEDNYDDSTSVVNLSVDDERGSNRVSKDFPRISKSSSECNSISKFYYRHSTSSPEMDSPVALSTAEDFTIRSASRSSASASPVPLNCQNGLNPRRNSVGTIDSMLTSSNSNNNDRHSLSSSSTGAIPLTKNVGVSVNFGKSNVKSNSSSSAGAQHIIPNGHQHQQHTPAAGTIITAPTSSSSENNHNNGNSAAINLGHGHIGTIAGPPSVSISSGGGLSSTSHGVNHGSPLPISPAVNAPTTCTNKGVPSSHNQQQQHLPMISSPHSNLRLSPHSPSYPMNQLESHQEGSTSGGNSIPSGNSSTLLSVGSRNGNSTCSSNNIGGVRTGSSSPSSSFVGKRGIASTSSSGGPLTSGSSSSNTESTSTAAGSKGETLTQPKSKTAGSTGSSTSSSSNKEKDRIVSQNVNGTLSITGVPSNESELQLFRVLQRANLLSYFDVMIELGGDDVQQLCDAGEEEFLEIMALIGMASKPLHVRRLQKALQEWMTQPGLFQAPVLPPGYPVGPSSGVNNSSLQPTPSHLAPVGVGQLPLRPTPYQSVTATTAGIPLLYPSGGNGTLSGSLDSKTSTLSKSTNQIQTNGIHNIIPSSNSPTGTSLANPLLTAAGMSPHFAAVLSNLSPNTNHQQHQSRYNHHNNHSHSNGQHTSSKGSISIAGGYEREKVAPLPLSISEIKIPTDQLIPSHFLEARMRTRSEPNSPASSVAGSPHPESRNSVSPVPVSLQDHEVQKLADAAIHLIRSLPPSVAEPKFSSKKKTSGDYELILRLSENDSRRMDEVRRVAAVFGRADAKRKTYKPLSLHELAINEAAAQLCKHVPALLTKREELLSLSRQVLRESGLPYAAISSTFSISLLTSGTSSLHNNNNDSNTKSKYEDNNGINRLHSLGIAASRDISDGNHSFFPGFHAKRLRLDAPSGIEIQEYSHGRFPSAHENPSPPTSSNGMQITELRSLPTRRSPSQDHIPSPLELVTVTTSDLRKNGMSSSGSKSSSVSSIDSISPPIRRPFALQSEDLSNNSCSSSSGSHNGHGVKMNHALSNLPSVKITSIPVNGGSISIMNHSGTTASGTNHHFNHHHHHYSGGPHNGMKLMPIKSEPIVN